MPFGIAFEICHIFKIIVTTDIFSACYVFLFLLFVYLLLSVFLILFLGCYGHNNKTGLKTPPPLPKEHNNDNKHEQQKKCQLGFEAVRLFLKHATMHVNVTRFDVFLPRRQDGV